MGCILNGMALTDDETIDETRIVVTKQLVINENLV